MARLPYCGLCILQHYRADSQFLGLSGVYYNRLQTGGRSPAWRTVLHAHRQPLLPFASDPSQVARMVNTMSALLSATCILFLFWTITHLTRKLLLNGWEDLTKSKLIAIEASGMVGALIYTFSDTFWFSAVEGEVYAYSSAFTAVVFWLILKWEDHADEPIATAGSCSSCI